MSRLEVAAAAQSLPALADDLHTGRPAWSRLLRDPTAVAGLVVVVLLAVAALLAPWLAPHDPDSVDVVNKLTGPHRAHPLGTDELGRDVLSRVLFAGRVSLATTFVVAAAISLIGLVVGALAGFRGGLTDATVSRLVDVMMSLPSFLLALAVTAALGPGLGHVLLAATVTWWATYARVVRAAVLVERERPYVEAARALGTSERRILVRHVLPNVVGPLMVLTTLELGGVLLGLTAFSFLGLGVQQPTPEWGAMLSDGRSYLSTAPHLLLAPGGCIFLVVLGCNLFGDGLRDALDPRGRIRR
ncbi:MAG TPA: ABC transporter permease [Acidimicrobiales bacterium]|nr:ABC transporter permease [Acidimicrobiales bacterium]